MNNNDKKVTEYKRKQIIKYVVITLSIMVIILEVLALLGVISVIWGLILFAIIHFVRRFIK